MDLESTERRLALAVRETYGEKLVSCAVFGSYARGTATPQSDLDVLVVARDLPRGRMARARQFDLVEEALPDEDLSAVFKTPEEAQRGSPLFWDMTEDVHVLFDRDDFLGDLLRRTRKQLEKNGAYKVMRGNAWYWVLKKDFSPGEVFTI